MAVSCGEKVIKEEVSVSDTVEAVSEEVKKVVGLEEEKVVSPEVQPETQVGESEVKKEVEDKSEWESLVRDSVVKYTNAAGEGDWDAMLDMTYEMRFEYNTREEILEVLKGIEASGIRVRTVGNEIGHISQPLVSSGKKYVRIETVSEQSMELLRPQLKTNGYVEATTIQLKRSYGEDAVRYDEEKSSFYFTSKQTIMGVSSQEGSWKFIPLDGLVAEKGMVPISVLAKWTADKHSKTN